MEGTGLLGTGVTAGVVGVVVTSLVMLIGVLIRGNHADREQHAKDLIARAERADHDNERLHEEINRLWEAYNRLRDELERERELRRRAEDEADKYRRQLGVSPHD